MALEELEQIEDKCIDQISQENPAEEVIPKTKWVVFFIGDRKYSIQEQHVMNILQSVQLYKYPFAPSFIDGVINFRNKIYPVVNFGKMTGTGSSDDSLTLHVIAKAGNECFSIRATRIVDFFMVPDNQYFATDESDENFIQGEIQIGEERIPALGIESINQNIISSCKTEAQQ